MIINCILFYIHNKNNIIVGFNILKKVLILNNYSLDKTKLMIYKSI